ncbi:MAG: glycosyltransferase family 39 protein [Pyrinomonadaceae bacterium]
MHRSKLAKRAWLLFFVGAFAVYFYGLGRYPFIGPDEPRYAEVAREMLMRGDLVTPTLGGRAWFEKPVLLYWVEMAAFGVFGVSEWAARLGTALAGLLTALVVYLLGKRVEQASAAEKERGLGLASGVTLATSVGLIGFSRGVNFDILLTLTLTVALACFFLSELNVDQRRRGWLLAGFYAAVGASLLAKGLVGIVLPAGVIFAYFMLRRAWPDRTLILSALWGIPLALIVAAVWYAPVIARHGWPFVDQFFIQHHFARFVTNKYHHPHVFYYYLPIIAMLAVPWTVFLLASLGAAPRWDWRAQTTEAKYRVFALAWLAVPVIFFSFSNSKLPGYVLPALPGAALLVGERLSRFLRGEGGPTAMRATGALLLLLGVGELIYVLRAGYISTNCALIIALPLSTAGALVLLWTRLRRLSLVFTVCALLIAVILTIECASAPVASRESVRDLLRLADTRGYSAAPVFHLYEVDHTTHYYAAGRLAYGPDGQPLKYEGTFQIRDAARRHGGGPILVFVHSDYTWQLTQYDQIETELIGDNGTVALLAVRAR